MRRHAILEQAKISQTTFTAYLRMGIILVDSSGDGEEREYSAASVARARLTRQLTKLGYRLEDVKALLEKEDAESILSKIESIPLVEFQNWFERMVPTRGRNR